jgi:hypothetical protein
MMSKKTRSRNYKRLVLGDVFEIPLSKKRLAYAQYVNYHRDPPVWGHLIRVLPGTFQKRPEAFDDIVQQQERFYTFFPAGSAVNRGLVTIVANEQIPDRCRKLPLFKATNATGPTTDTNWFLWDGKMDIKVDKLSPEQVDLSIHEIISFGLLLERIESGWSPRDEVLVEPPSRDVRRAGGT